MLMFETRTTFHMILSEGEAVRRASSGDERAWARVYQDANGPVRSLVAFLRRLLDTMGQPRNENPVRDLREPATTSPHLA